MIRCGLGGRDCGLGRDEVGFERYGSMEEW